MQDSQKCSQCHAPHSNKGVAVCSYSCLLASQNVTFAKKHILGLIGFSLIILANLASFIFKEYNPYLLRAEIIIGAVTYLFLSWPFFKYFRYIRLITGHFYGLLWLVSLADFLIGVGWGLYSMTHEEILMRPLFVTGIFLVLVVNYFVPREFALRQKIIFEPSDQLDLRPKTARLIVKNVESEVELQSLKVGDIIKILPREVIPCDGQITAGTTSVNETIILGENSIKLKTKGDSVLGASMNRDGIIFVEIIKPIDQDFIVKKIQLFKKSLESKPIFFAKKSHFYIVLLPWILIGGLKYFFLTQIPLLHLVESFVIALSLYGVIGLQRIFFLPALWESMRKGILIPNLGEVQRLSVLNALFFDKTGTLTQGQYSYSDVLLEKGTNQGTFLSTVFSLEAAINHPIAAGVKTHPWYLEVPAAKVTEAVYQPGLGVSGKVCEKGGTERFCAFGNIRLMKRLRFSTTKALRDKMEELEATGETALLCGWDGAVRGIFSLADVLRPDVKSILSKLKDLNVEPYMLTGDHDEMISHLHVTHGLKAAYTRCLPTEKMGKISRKSGPLTMVGVVGTLYDDKAVLQSADVGILLGTADAIDESTDNISIFGKGLTKIADMIAISQKYGASWKHSKKIAFSSIMLASLATIIPYSHPIIVGGLVTVAWNFILKNKAPVKKVKPVQFKKNTGSLARAN